MKTFELINLGSNYLKDWLIFDMNQTTTAFFIFTWGALAGYVSMDIFFNKGIDFSKNDTSNILDKSIVTKIDDWDKNLSQKLSYILKRYKNNVSK